uniref:Uncharacterized protein n=1 Tax=Amphimedon queenslandica TaxID=400682 RepID=A0A1X7SJR9_AMPQE
MNDRQTAQVPSPSPTHITIEPTSSLISSASTFVISLTIPLTPTTQPTCIIVCVRKRSKSLSKRNPEELSTSLKILTTSTNDDHDTNIDILKDNPAYVTTTGSTSGSTTLQDNPAYAPTAGFTFKSTTLQDNPAYVTTTGFTSGSTTLQDNPAYASISNTVPVDDDT